MDGNEDVLLSNPWLSEQYFLFEDGLPNGLEPIVKYFDLKKSALNLKLGAMEWETHTTIQNIPLLIYFNYDTYDFFGKKVLWVNLGVEPKKAPFGTRTFYDDIGISLSSLNTVYSEIFPDLPFKQDEVFLKYSYITHDFFNEDEIKGITESIGNIIKRDAFSSLVPYGHGKITKLGVGETPINRKWKEEIEGFEDDTLTNFIYPDVFLVHSTPYYIDYHDGAQEVVAYHTLLKNLGIVTALYKSLILICKHDGSNRILQILNELMKSNSVAYSMVRSFKRKKIQPPLGRMVELGEITLKYYILESLNSNWSAIQENSLYPSTVINRFINELLSLRAAYVDDKLQNGAPITPQSKPLCHPYGDIIFPDCDRGMALLSTFSHLSRLIYEKIRDVSAEEDFKNLILTVLERFHPITEVHHGKGIPDILIPCENDNYVVIECKIWRYPKQIIKDLNQIGGYIGPTGNCGFLVYFVPKQPKVNLIDINIDRRNLGYDSVCSPNDSIINISIPGREGEVPIVVLFLQSPTGHTRLNP